MRGAQGIWQQIAEMAPTERRVVRRAAKRVLKRQRAGVIALAHAINGAPRTTGEAGAWVRIRNEILAERGPRCDACETLMPDAGLVHLHHIRPRSMAGTDTRDNAALLCPNCHAKAHWRYRQDGVAIPCCLADLLALLASEPPKSEKLGPLYILTA